MLPTMSERYVEAVMAHMQIVPYATSSLRPAANYDDINVEYCVKALVFVAVDGNTRSRGSLVT